MQTVEGQVRAMLLALESRLDAKIPVTHHVIAWLVEHAADVLNKFAVGIDGRTTYERIKGKKYHREMVEGRRRAMYKIPCKPEGRIDDGKVGTWDLVVAAGERPKTRTPSSVNSNNMFIGRSSLANSESWSLDHINNIIGTA